MYNGSFYRARFRLAAILRSRPGATAQVRGGSNYPDIVGIVNFFQTDVGVVVYAEIVGLPHGQTDSGGGVFGFHIHNGETCDKGAADDFAGTLAHYNPSGQRHPYHAGDLAPLFEGDGVAMMCMLTSRFKLDQIIGKTVVIHDLPDDFTTQPSGNSGKKIACGKIARV